MSATPGERVTAKARIAQLEQENADLSEKLDAVEIRLEVARLAVGVIQASPGSSKLGTRLLGLFSVIETYVFAGVDAAAEVLKPVPDDARIS